MAPRSHPTGDAQPAFGAWLRHNPTGIPRRVALRRVLLGVVIGILTGALTGRFVVGEPHLAVPGIGGGIVAGMSLGALGVVVLARMIDRSFGRDTLVGYSGVMRMLLHAGELSFLGAIGGGAGGATASAATGLAAGALGMAVAGGLIYRLRGLGAILGVTAGLLAGGIGGAVGGWIGGLAG